VGLLFFAFIAGEFFVRFAYDRPIRHSYDGGVVTRRREMDRNIGSMIFGVSAMTIFIIIRGIYRVVELSDGWNGVIISTQWLFSSSILSYLLPPQSADHRFIHSFRYV
jgi:hypothetical protein